MNIKGVIWYQGEENSFQPDFYKKALPVLMDAAQDDSVNYLDYVEIVSAIDALGGERPSEREFTGDPYYESLKRV